MTRAAQRILAILLALPMLALAAGCGVVGAKPIHLHAEFPNAIGLYAGNDVSVLGVKVGRIDAIHPAGTHMLVDMTLDPGARIPADAGAVTVSPALVNNRRVELTPVYRGGPTIADGTLIPLARTKTPIEIDEVFGAADDLFSQLGKVEGGTTSLNDALDAAAGTFQGNGDKLHKAVQGLTAAVGVGADQRNQLIRVIQDVDDLSQKAVRYDGTIRSLTGNLTAAVQLIDRQGPELTGTINHLGSLLAQVNTLIEANRGTAVDTFHNLQGTASSLAGHTRELAEAANTLPTAFQNLANAVDPQRQAVRGHLNVQDMLLPPQLLQGVCQENPIPVLCAMTGAANSGNPADVQKLIDMLLGGGR